MTKTVLCNVQKLDAIINTLRTMAMKEGEEEERGWVWRMEQGCGHELIRES